jgi:RHS repeat-associated protein
VLEDDGTVICAEGADLTVNCKGPDMPFAFNGMWRSEVSGLSYMRNRWYSPHLAQFMSHDPLEYIDSYNLYAFASLDPINFWDPWGLGAKDLMSDVGAQDPIGVVNAVRKAAAALDEAAHDLGDGIKNKLEANRKQSRQQMGECSNFVSCAAAHGGAFANELAAEILPQNGHEVKLGVATAQIKIPRLPSMKINLLHLQKKSYNSIPWGKYCRNGCEAVADAIKSEIGGTIHRIVPGLPRGQQLGPRSGIKTEWHYHDVVVKDGRVYDAMTGPDGVSIKEFKAQWEWADDIKFGF